MVSGPLLWRRLFVWAALVALTATAWVWHAAAVSPYLWALIAGLLGLGLYAIAVIGPGLASERLRPGSAGLDDRLLLGMRLLALVALVFGVVDGERHHWSAPMPAALRIAGVALYLAGVAIALQAMAHNQFFSPKIRIQDDRGHHVIDSGPYAVVRHPGYVGMVFCCAALPFAFGSWWTCALMGPCVLFFLRRVGVEDRFLHDSLPGYRDYAARVRSRLVPGVW
jgi:protein-S-isoprenylcysteine O-methyltransferase Ste14